MARPKHKPRSKTKLPVVHRHAAGIDIGSTFHVVAIPNHCDPQPVRSFKSFTSDLHRLAEWLQNSGITTVAMESTGVYWIPAYEILEQHGFEVLLVNARFVKNVPGRKTDVNDAQWIQRLHEHGLLRGSFRPQEQVVALRSFLRQRERLTQSRARHIQHMQKALMQMNLQLHHVLQDITGVTGMAIIHAILDGEREPESLARFRDCRCKATVETFQSALTGNYRAEHIFALQQAIELYEVFSEKIAACDQEIEVVLSQLNVDQPPPTEELPPRRHKTRSRNEPAFDVRGLLFGLLGVDLTQIHGVGPFLALQLIAECGVDMSRWPSAKHFTSWLTLAPGNKISGGKVLSSKTRRSKNRAAHLFRLAARSVSRTNTALGAFYRRLGVRVGKAKAITATARKLAVLFFHGLRDGVAYLDPGADYYEQNHKSRVLANLKRRAQEMGYQLIEEVVPEPAVVGVS